MAFPVAAVASAVPGVLSLFSKKKQNPYAGQITETANRVRSTGDAYGAIAAGGRAEGRSLMPGYRESFASLVDEYKTDPYTDANRAALLGKRTAGVAPAFDAAKTNLSADLAVRGLSPDSQGSVGGLAAIEGARGNAFAVAGNQITTEADADRERRRAALLSLFGGARSQALGQEQLGLSGQGAADASLLSLFTGQGARWENRDAQDRQDYLSALAGSFKELGAMFPAKAENNEPSPGSYLSVFKKTQQDAAGGINRLGQAFSGAFARP